MELMEIQVNTGKTVSGKNMLPEKAKKIERKMEHQTRALTPTYTLNLDTKLEIILV